MRKTNIYLLMIFVFVYILCTFYDLQISTVLFNKTSRFGIFFEAYGELPMGVIGAFSAAILFVTTTQHGNMLSLFAKIGFGLALLVYAVTGALVVGIHVGLATPLILLLAALLTVICIALATQIPDRYISNARQVAKVGIILAFATVVVINGIKMLWGRQRFRSMVDPLNAFTPWFMPQQLTIDNERMSFPSGHSASSAVIIWITLLPLFVRKLQGKEGVLFAIAVVWTMLVMLSRIIIGAHFGTDVLMGMAITISLFTLLKRIFIREKVTALE